MKKFNQIRRCLTIIFIAGFLCINFSACQEKPEYYTAGDFEKAPKTDAHFHYNSTSMQYFELASGFNFRLLSPNVDSRISIDKQLNTAAALRQAYPGKFSFFGTFSVDSFATKGFAENTIARIEQCMKAGASGIKIWKNIGMVLKDKDGRYVMADDPGFDPVFKYIVDNKIPVLGHLGEPKNCWLPFEEMTDTL